MKSRGSELLIERVIDMLCLDGVIVLDSVSDFNFIGFWSHFYFFLIVFV